MGSQPVGCCSDDDSEATQPMFVSIASTAAPKAHVRKLWLTPSCSRIGKKAIVMSSIPAAAVCVLLLVVLGWRHNEDTQLPVRFLVVGDWGRLGQYNQTQVAALMGQKAEVSRPDFIISTGDNFYPSGLSSPNDEAFSTSFINTYTAKSLQLPFYAVLGNHDYADSCTDEDPYCSSTGELFYSPLHQLGSALAGRDWRWSCGRSYERVLAGGRVHLFFIDTSPFVLKYSHRKWANATGGLKGQSWAEQLAGLQASLLASKADWKIVIGHHPPRSNGHHNNTDELIQHLEPVLQMAGVQAYFAGHDHNLEHIHVPNALPHYLISGGGSKSDRPFIDRADSLFQWESSGFVSVEVDQQEMVVEFLGYGTPIDDIIPMYIARIPRVQIALGRRHTARRVLPEVAAL